MTQTIETPFGPYSLTYGDKPFEATLSGEAVVRKQPLQVRVEFRDVRKGAGHFYFDVKQTSNPDWWYSARGATQKQREAVEAVIRPIIEQLPPEAFQQVISDMFASKQRQLDTALCAVEAEIARIPGYTFASASNAIEYAAAPAKQVWREEDSARRNREWEEKWGNKA
jgi:hypothetical protein